MLGALRVRQRPRVSLELVGTADVGGRLLLKLHIETPAEVTVRDARLVFRRSLTFPAFSGEALGSAARYRRTVLATETFSRIGRLAPGARHEEISWFRIPWDAPPSGWARRIHSVYRVSARVRFGDAPTIRAWSAVRVLSPRSLNRRAERGGVVSSATAENRLQVHLEQRHARPGQRLRGVVWAAPPPAGTAPPVVVELLRREENSRLYHQDRGFGIEWTVERHVLSDGLSGPDWATLPFDLTVPAGACPTIDLGHSGVRWLVRARTGATRRRGDSVAEEVNVFTGKDDARPQ
jgi:hypothetical protein